MFEIIWSNFADDYIIRRINAFSSIKPKFIGTYEECKTKIANYK